jgi:WD40 repeat protein
MGVVYRAEDPGLQRLVALKAMLPALAASESARQRFLREARAAAAIKHDHIVTIHQVGEDRGVPFLAMEFLEGEPLDDRLKREGRLPLADVLRIGREMAEGLAAAHERGLIHRDIKPANVWLEGKKGRVKILDFGLARAATDEAHLTQPGAIVGTPAYMAPEQGQGQDVGPRCDLFSLGCVLYRMATGEAPFRGTDMISTLMAVATENPRPPVSLNIELPTELSDLIMQLLAKRPEERPASAQAVAEALERIAREPLPPKSAQAGGRLEKRVVPTPRAGRGGRRIAVAALALVLLVLVPLGFWLGGVIVRLRTPDGVLVVEVNEPNPDVYMDGQKVTVAWDKGGKHAEITIKPGTRKVEVKKDGFTVTGGEVELKDGERRTLIARFEPSDAPPPRDAKSGTSAPRPPGVPAPSAALEALRREQVPAEALAAAGDGDPGKAPASLVGVLGEAGPVHTPDVPDAVFSLAFSGDGRWLASAGTTTILVRDVVTGRVQRVLKGHTSLGPWHAPVSVAFSRDSRTLVSASPDGTMKLWPMDRAEEPQTLQPKLGEIWGMAVSADGRFVAAGGRNGRIHVWKWGQWDTPSEIKVTPDEQGRVGGCLALSPDGELLAVGREEDRWDVPIRIYKTTDGKVTLSVTANVKKGPFPLVPQGITFSRDGRYLAAFVGAWKAGVWDVASGKSVADFPFEQFGSVAFSPDGKVLAVPGIDHVVLYDVASQKRERVLDAGHGPFRSVAFSPDGKLLAGSCHRGIVHVWDTTTWKEKYLERGHLHYVRGLAISPDVGALLSVGDDDTLRRWDLGRPGMNEILHQFLAEDFHNGPTPQGSASVAYSPDGRSFALLVRGNGALRGKDETAMIAWDAATTKKRWSLQLSPATLCPHTIAFSPDGKTLAGQCVDGGVRLWDAENGREIYRFGSMGTSSGLAFSQDGKLLAVASQDKEGSVKVWNVASGAEIHSWKDTAMTAAVFRPDGQVLVTGHSDGTISVWDLAEGKKKRTLRGHAAQVQSLKFIPDGKTLISSGHDGTIRLWNPDWERARQVIALGPAHQRLVMDLDPSGKYLFAAGHGPAIYVLRLPRDGNQASP